MLKLGWLLFVVGMIGGMAGAFYIAMSDEALPLMESWYCEDYEELIRTSRQTYEGTSFNFFCEEVDGGARRSVDFQFFLTIMAAFIPLFLSIPLIVIGSIRFNRNKQQQVLSALGGQGFSYSDGGEQVFVRSSNAPVHDINSVINAVMSGAKNVGDAQKLTLKQKLEQLQEAYDSGLITYDELQRRKDRVLDEIAED